VPFTPQQRNAVLAAFAARGYEGELRVARVLSEDERIFVVPGGHRLDQVLAAELQEILRDKVWVVDPSPAWSDTEPFA
jgi:hypothetical protein